MNRREAPRAVAAGWAGVLWLLCSSASSLHAQQVEVPAFNAIANPPAPAWVLLGLEPAAVERPSNPAELGLSLIRATDTFDQFPKEWAVETAPYWLLPHPDLEWTDDIDRSIGEAFLRTLTLSFASAATGPEERLVTSLATAARFSLISGVMPGRTRRRAEQLKALLTSLAVAAEERAQLIRDSIKVDSIFTVKLAEDSAAALSWLTAVEDSIAALVRETGEVQSRQRAARAFQLNASVREGFFLEVAGGWALDVPRNVVDSAETRQWGVWLSPSWIGKTGSLVGVARYLSAPVADDTTFDGALDVGVRGILQQPRFGVSLEAIYRRVALDVDPDPTEEFNQDQWRLAGIVEYRILGDTWLRATFGRDFERTETEGDLLAQLSLSFDFGTERYQVPEP